MHNILISFFKNIKCDALCDLGPFIALQISKPPAQVLFL